MVFKAPAEIARNADTNRLRRVLIVTALKPEMQAVRAHLTHLASSSGRSGTVYECGQFTAEGEDWLVVVAECGPGNYLAQSVVTHALGDFGSFELVLFSGIAGSRKSDAPIGSVIAANHVYNPYSGKYANGEFSSRPRAIPIDHRLVQLARKVSRDEDWHDRIRPTLNGPELPPPNDCPQPFPPGSFVAPIVAVESVVGDTENDLAHMIDLHGSDAHAVEMEGYGAVFAAEMDRTPIMVVRGISDMMSDKTAQRDAILQPLAAIFAAAFTIELLNLWGQSQSRPPIAPPPSSPLATGASPESPPTPPYPPAAGVAPARTSTRDTLADTMVVVLNFEGDASEFPPERVEAITATIAREIGVPVRIVKSETGSYRLFIAFEGKIGRLPVDILRKKFGEEHGVELFGAVDVREYEDIRAFEAEIEPPSHALLSWPTQLPDGRHLTRPEVDQLRNIVGERDHSTTVVLGGPGSGKSTLLATFSAIAARDDWPMLALKADLLPPDIETDQDLQRYLGLSIAPAPLLERIASFRPVLLVIDQLDALAGYLDLRTGRLNVLLNLVRRLGRTQNVHIVLSARTFEFEHDVRLRTISAESINLQLPSWAEVLTVLDAHGIEAEGWPRDAQEVMRSPQALAIFLRLKDHTGDQPFTTYQAMLDRLWTERILSLPSGARIARLTTDIAQTMAEEENLWLAKVRFEDQIEDLNALLGLKILATTETGTSIGFTHQTLFDHALARSFAREKGRLSKYVLERQDSLFIRPKLWAGLTYLRAVELTTYQRELEVIWSDAGLRRHLKMLLIDFLGQQTKPTDREELLIACALAQPMYRQLAFRAVSGSPGWFHRLKEPFVADAMTLDMPSGSLAAGVLNAAWPFAREEVAALIREHWSLDTTYDTVSWNVLTSATNWSDEVLELTVQIVSRSEISPQAVDYVITTLGVDFPAAATKLVRAKLDRDLANALKESAERQNIPPPEEEQARIDSYLAHSPAEPITKLVEGSRDWDALGALAENAPALTLEHLWPWFLELVGALRQLEEPQDGDLGYAISHYLEYRFEGEHSLGLPEPSILGALRIAAEKLAASDQQAFETWVADNAEFDGKPVHRLFAYAMSTRPKHYAQLALDYILADKRRFYLGGIEDSFSTSKRLVRAVAPYWSDAEIKRFVDAVHAYSPKPPARLRETHDRRWFKRLIRRIKLGHLQALPAERVSEDIRNLIREEVRVFGDDRVGVTFSGVQFIGSPMSRDAFVQASDEDVINAFQELPDATGWDHPKRHMIGGNIQLSREFADFAKGDPERAARLIRKFEPSFGRRAAGYALDAMAENADPKLITTLFTELVDRRFDGEEFRNSVARAVERLVRRNYTVGDEVLGHLEQWLKRKTPLDVDEDAKLEEIEALAEEPAMDEADEKDGDETRSILWDYMGFSIVPSGNYPVLEAITRILIAQPDHDRLGVILTAHLKRPEDPKVWQALLHLLIYFRPSDESVRPKIISEIFRRYPTLLRTREAVQLLAHGQWWAPDMVREVLAAWLSDTVRMRQAYGELVALFALVQPKLEWASEALDAIVEKADRGDTRVGAAFSAVNLWKEPNHRHSATELLVRLIPQADHRIWHAVFDLFRIVDELMPDSDTVLLLTVIADNIEGAGPVNANFVVERLQTLLPHEAMLVARLTQGLVTNWREDLGDIRTGISVAGSELVDLAVTLHRLGPETRDAGTRIFEDLLFIDAWAARQTLDEIDSRFRSEHVPVRRRLQRRSARARRDRQATGST